MNKRAILKKIIKYQGECTHIPEWKGNSKDIALQYDSNLKNIYLKKIFFCSTCPLYKCCNKDAIQGSIVIEAKRQLNAGWFSKKLYE